MKKLVLLFAALLVAGCGEKSSSEGSESTGESAEPSADTAKPPVAKSPSEEPSDTPSSLSDADVERLLKEAVEFASLEGRDGLRYKVNESKPYSGWAKIMYDSGQAERLGRFKDGKEDGRWTGWHENGQMEFLNNFKDGKLDGLRREWYENGQKRGEGTFKDGKVNGLRTNWHENGQKWAEGTYKDGGLVSVKYWNSKGEEVETFDESSE